MEKAKILEIKQHIGGGGKVSLETFKNENTTYNSEMQQNQYFERAK